MAGRSAQRRRLALLALLAVEGRPLKREKVIGLLWPETETDRARRLLSESLYVLRKELGEDALPSSGDEVWLDRGIISCDVVDFLAAADRNDADTALALYAGPFLDGVFIDDAHEFGLWVDGQRDRFARRYAELLDGAAEAASARADHAAAVAAFRRLAAHDPYDGRVALRLMRELVASGNRAAALQHARVHATLLRDEFGAEPAPEITALEEELRASPPPIASAATAAVSEVRDPLPVNLPVDSSGLAGTAPRDSPAEPAAREAGAVGAGGARPPPAAGSLLARKRGRLAIAGALAVLLGVALGTGQLLRASRAASFVEDGIGSTTLVAVMPFGVRAAPEYTYLADGLASLLGTSLNGAGAWRSVDPFALLSRIGAEHARGVLSPESAREVALGFGAAHWVMGSLVETGGHFRISASLYGADSVLAVATAEGREAEIPYLVDEIVRQLLADRMQDASERLARVASLTTSSLPALKAYLDGERDFRAARYTRAADAFARAVAEDPTFALAHYRLSAASEWSFDFATARRAADDALRHSERLSARDQRLLAAWHAFVSGDADRAERLYEAIVTTDPHDVEAWSGLGEVRIHYNGVRGRHMAESRAAFERVLRLAPDYGEARFHMLELAAANGSRETFDSLLAGADPANEQATAWSVVRAMFWGDAAAREAALDRLRGEDEVVAGIAAARLAVSFRDFAAAERVAAVLTAPERPADWRAAGHVMLAQLAAASDRVAEADRELAVAMEFEPAWAIEMQGLLALHPAWQDADRRRVARAALEAWNPGARQPSMSFFFATHADVHAHLRLYLLALLSLAMDDESAARRWTGELMSVGHSADSRALAAALAGSIRAHEHVRRGDHERALDVLDESRLQAPLERIALSSFFSQALDRWLRASTLERLGRTEEAIRWYDTLAEGSDVMFAAEALRRREALTGETRPRS